MKSPFTNISIFAWTTGFHTNIYCSGESMEEAPETNIALALNLD